MTVIGCWGGYPKTNEASSGYLVEHDGYKVLLDCGSGILAKLQNYIKPEALDAVLLSHYHPDHTADIGVLQHARLIQGFIGEKPKTLSIFGHALNEQEFSKLSYKDVTAGIAYDPTNSLTIGPFKVSFIQTSHPVPCYAMRLEAEGKSIVYTADTAFFKDLELFAKKADLLLCECNLYSGYDGSAAGHMTSSDAGRLATSAEVEELVLTHLPHFGDIHQLKKEAEQIYKGKVQLAKEGLSFDF